MFGYFANFYSVNKHYSDLKLVTKFLGILYNKIECYPSIYTVTDDISYKNLT